MAEKVSQYEMLVAALDEGWTFTRVKQVDGSWAIFGSPEESPLPKNDADMNSAQDVVNEFLGWLMMFDGTPEELHTTFIERRAFLMSVISGMAHQSSGEV